MTIKCEKCNHKFLEYAVNCPECDWTRPVKRRVDTAMIVSLAFSVAALLMTFVFGSKIKERTEMPFQPSQSATVRH